MNVLQSDTLFVAMSKLREGGFFIQAFLQPVQSFFIHSLPIVLYIDQNIPVVSPAGQGYGVAIGTVV